MKSLRSASAASQSLLSLLATASAIGMFLVLVMGATVTNTNSATGCGRSWPLCNGRFIPEFAVSTLIEFSHRAVTGIEGIVVVAVAIGGFMLHRNRRDIQVTALLTVAFTVLQAGMGAAAVMVPEDTAVLALHFGISLLAVASATLCALCISSGDRLRSLRTTALPLRLRWAIWGSTIYTYLVVYSGAFVRHGGMSLNCADWPLCGGRLVPDITGPAGIVFAHRIAAASLLLIMGWLVWRLAALGQERPELFVGAIVAVALVVLQSLAGAFIVFSHLSLLSALLHAGTVGLFFAALGFLSMQALPWGMGSSERSTPDARPVAVAS